MTSLRLVRTLHTTRALANVAVQSHVDAPAPAPAAASKPLRQKFTPKGRLIPVRPPRQIRVTLPSGFPEPPSYPPPPEYFEEIANIKKTLLEETGTQEPKPHPLWAFFHVPRSGSMEISAEQEQPPDGGSVGRLDDEESALESGRAWNANELRGKSFEDLHTLWYILLRERNVLATQREERRRLGVNPGYGGELLTKRGFRIRKSMARIKFVLNERRLALISAGAASLPHRQAFVPSTVVGQNDPMAHTEALKGTAEAPSLEKLTGVRPAQHDRLQLAQKVAVFKQQLKEEGTEIPPHHELLELMAKRKKEAKKARKRERREREKAVALESQVSE